MFRVAFRETLVLLAATAISWLTVWLNPRVGFDTRLLGLVLPFLYCVMRLAVLKYPPHNFPWLRRTGFQIAMGLALVCLLVFEEMVALMAGNNVPWLAWAALSSVGLGYVMFFCLADAWRRSPRERPVRKEKTRPPAWEPSSWGLETVETHEPLPRDMHGDPPREY